MNDSDSDTDFCDIFRYRERRTSQFLLTPPILSLLLFVEVEVLYSVSVYCQFTIEYLLLVRLSIFLFLLLITHLFYLNQGALFRFCLFIHSLANLVILSVGVAGDVCLKIHCTMLSRSNHNNRSPIDRL